ncbi:energy transducer TonB [Burkholderiaceae bacterium UC74_6]
MNTFALDRSGLQPEARTESTPPPARPREPAAVVAGSVASERLAEAETGTLGHGWHAAPRKRSVWIAILALHGGLAWAMAHSLMQPAQPAKPTPVEVRLIEPPRPKPQPPLPQMEIQAPVVAPVPFVQPPNVNLSPVVTVAEAPPVVVPVKPAPVAAPVLPVTAASSGPKEIAASALRYIVEPHGHIPRMSRKLGESGTVVLHIVVGADGLLKSAALKKSSGFERLDQQALLDIRTARFEPYLEKGQAIEVETDAGIQYEYR